MKQARLLTILALLVALAGLVAAPQPAQAQEVGVTPPYGGPGTEFAFFADGFEPNRRVAYWVNFPDGTIDADQDLYAVSANNDGRADWMWEAPDNAQPGGYLMVAEGQEGTTRTIPFEIRASEGTPAAAPPAEADVNVNPTFGPPGTEFDFFAEGFEPNRRVAYWVNFPDGTIDSDESLYAVSANNDGRADWSWEAPGNAPAGQYTMVARGQNDVEHVIPFEVRAGSGTPGAEPPAGTNAEVTPNVGSPGTEFAFFAEGFEGNRRVAYWVNLPDGTIDSDESLYAVSANRDGRADWTWEAPGDAPAGQYTMVARGQNGLEHVIPFEVR
jgi:5-hydroxyisourate hydrolase-like protein (transthyretin family)